VILLAPVGIRKPTPAVVAYAGHEMCAGVPTTQRRDKKNKSAARVAFKSITAFAFKFGWNDR